MMTFPGEAVPSGPGSDPSLDSLELGEPARDGNTALVVKPVLVLGFPEKLAEERVVEINHRHQNPVKVLVLVLLSHVHRQVSFRHRVLTGTVLRRLLTQRHVPRTGFDPAQRLRSFR